MNKTVLSFVNKLEGYKTAIKQLHWDAKNMSQHELCDDIADSIAEFQDTVSEVEQSITGNLKVNSLNPTEYKIKDLKSFVQDVLDETNSFYKKVKDMGDTYVGMASDCESFLSDMQRKLYLVNFTMKEDFKRELRSMLSESMPKNLANHDEVDKFMGRRPKTIKARINQIYRIVKKYGIDSKLYSDENWQAIDDYYRAISSLGCEVEMKPCGHISNIDSMESDGGYCDYGDDGMPLSKQYAIKIMFEDGMNIDGYIKCMAAGTVSDPFSKYDTCIVLWPKNNRVLESRYMREENLSWNRSRELYDNGSTTRKLGNGMTRITHKDGKVSDLWDDNPSEFWKKHGEKLNGGIAVEGRQIKLSEAELKQVVKEAAIRLIREYGDKEETRHKMAAAAKRGVNRGDSTPYENAMDSLHKRGSSKEELGGFQKEFEEGIRLGESELKQVVKEAAMQIINEYNQRMAKTKGFVKSTHGHRSDKKKVSPEEKAEARRRLGIKELAKVEEESIEIKPENKGKFTATKKATGKSTEELKHSKNPLTRKRATFAANAKKWVKK